MAEVLVEQDHIRLFLAGSGDALSGSVSLRHDRGDLRVLKDEARDPTNLLIVIDDEQTEGTGRSVRSHRSSPSAAVDGRLPAEPTGWYPPP